MSRGRLVDFLYPRINEDRFLHLMLRARLWLASACGEFWVPAAHTNNQFVALEVGLPRLNVFKAVRLIKTAWMIEDTVRMNGTAPFERRKLGFANGLPAGLGLTRGGQMDGCGGWR